MSHCSGQDVSTDPPFLSQDTQHNESRSCNPSICTGVFRPCGLFTGTAMADGSDAAATARKLLDLAGVRGGIVVHLGCGDGRLTAALHVSDRYTVHGLEADPAEVAEARSHVQSLGLYGPVSVEQYSDSTLPYTDNLINLIVVQDPDRVPAEELLRVLAPDGVACIGSGDKWGKIVKPRPGNIDDWTHYLHDASNNAVADDSVVGPPRSLQWVAPPLWLRSHETPSGIQSPVSDGRRLFYFFDEGLIGITDERLPDRWSLVCRDAFNGKLLWKKPLAAFGWREWSRERFEGKDWTRLSGKRMDVPAGNQRLIVAQGGRVYTTVGYAGPMSILDAATGDIVTTIEETSGTREILVRNGVAVAYTRQVPEDVARRRGVEDTAEASLTAVDSQTGKLLWQEQTGPIRPLALAIDGGRVVYLTGKDMVRTRCEDRSGPCGPSSRPMPRRRRCSPSTTSLSCRGGSAWPPTRRSTANPSGRSKWDRSQERKVKTCS